MHIIFCISNKLNLFKIELKIVKQIRITNDLYKIYINLLYFKCSVGNIFYIKLTCVEYLITL